MAETLKPCWCNSRITTSSPSPTTQTSPEPSGVRWPPVGCWPAIAVLRQVPSHPQPIEVTDFQPPDLTRIAPAMTAEQDHLEATAAYEAARPAAFNLGARRKHELEAVRVLSTRVGRIV